MDYLLFFILGMNIGSLLITTIVFYLELKKKRYEAIKEEKWELET